MLAQRRAQSQKATRTVPVRPYLNNFIETIHRSRCGGAGICGRNGVSRLADGDDARCDDGASTSQAGWNGCGAGFGVGVVGGTADGNAYGESGGS